MFSTLRNGPTLPDDAFRLAVSLEGDGFTLARRGEDGLRVIPNGRELTPAEREQITRWKLHLLAVVDYCASGVVDSA